MGLPSTAHGSPKSVTLITWDHYDVSLIVNNVGHFMNWHDHHHHFLENVC